MLNGESRNLDVLRAVAVLSVFLAHLFQTFSITTLGPITAGSIGTTGVLIFFVHTSCVLMMSLDRLRVPYPAMTFYVRRIFRIYPLSIASVLAMVVFHIPAEPLLRFWPPGALAVFSNLALIQNVTDSPNILGPLWSLPWEVQMYLAIPLLHAVIRKRTDRWLSNFLLAWVLIIVTRVAGIVAGVRVLTLLQYVPCFLGGILAYHLAKQVDPRIPGGWWPFIVGVQVLCAGLVMRATAGRSYVFVSLGWYMICISLGAIIPLCQEMRASVLTKAGHIVAKYSYGIYLSHCPVFWLAFVYLKGRSSILQWSVMILSATAAPVVAFHAIEDPLIRLGRRITGYSRGRKEAALAVAK